MKTVDDEFRHVTLCHDLTWEQRTERKKLVVDAKNREENDNDGFLFRVRGSVGNWRVVKFRKTKIN